VPAAAVAAPQISLGGQPIAAALWDDLIELEIDLAASAPGQVTLRFYDVDGAHATRRELRIGSKVQVALPRLAGPRRELVDLTPFEVTELGVDAHEGGMRELVVVAHDVSHRLALGTKIQTFLQSSPADVLQQVVPQRDIELEVRDSDMRADKLPYFLVASSPRLVLDELAARYGLVWWCDDGRIVVDEPGSRAKVSLSYPDELLSCRTRVTGRYVGRVEVRGWDHTKMDPIVGSATTPTDIPAKDLASAPGARWSSGEATITVTGAAATTPNEAKALAKAIADGAAQRRLDVRGEAHSTPGLLPGGTVEVRNLGSASGAYEVHRVQHVFRHQSGLRTRFEAGGRGPSLLAPDPGTASVPSSIHFGGIVVGVVTANDDPGKLGRVRVKFPWLTDQDSSDWARVLVFGGGEGQKGARGTHFLPDVNDEVLVGFEGGDLRKPVVLGTLLNPKTKAFDYQVKGGAVQRRSITSRRGHVLQLVDETDPKTEGIQMLLADGTTRLRVGADQVEVETPGGNPISLKSGNASITITKEGDISISGKNVTIESKGDLKVDSKGNVQVDAAMKTTLTGKLGLTASSQMNTEVSGTAVTTVKGSTVMIN